MIVFDDLVNRPHAADILVDPTPRRCNDDYAHLVPDGCRVFTGPHHAMVRQAWRKLRRETCARHAKDHPARRILLSMGATDPINASSKVIAALAACGLDIETDVVLGHGAPHRQAVEDALTRRHDPSYRSAGFSRARRRGGPRHRCAGILQLRAGGAGHAQHPDPVRGQSARYRQGAGGRWRRRGSPGRNPERSGCTRREDCRARSRRRSGVRRCRVRLRR